MKKIFMVMIMFLAICGCTYNSDVFEERATLIEKVHLPNTLKTDVAIGFSGGRSGGLTFTPITTGHNEIFYLTFKCEKHNQIFSMNVTKEAYFQFDLNEVVKLKYYDVLSNSDDHFVKAKTTEILKVKK